MTDHALNCKIRRTWNTLCAVHPGATTPRIASLTAAACRVTVTRVFQAF